MHESDTYEAILDEGRVMFAKKAVLAVGEERFGLADEAVKAQVDGIGDLERLKRMLLRAVNAANWQEILDTP
jgi:hypothetical protein